MTPKQARPKVLSSQTVEVPAPCGRVYVTVTFKEDQPFEVFARLGKSGGCGSAVVNAVCTTMSIGLRSGVDIKDLMRGIECISCHRPPTLDHGEPIASCVDAIAKAIKSILPGN